MKRLPKIHTNCLFCEKDIFTQPSRFRSGRGRYCSKMCKNLSQKGKILIDNTGRKASEKTREKMSNMRKFEKHWNWKGDNVGYTALHTWIKKILGKPIKCKDCGAEQSSNGEKKHFQWANISGEYKRDITDWVSLCVSCHKIYDNTKRRINKINLTIFYTTLDYHERSIL